MPVQRTFQKSWEKITWTILQLVAISPGTTGGTVYLPNAIRPPEYWNETWNDPEGGAEGRAFSEDKQSTMWRFIEGGEIFRCPLDELRNLGWGQLRMPVWHWANDGGIWWHFLTGPASASERKSDRTTTQRLGSEVQNTSRVAMAKVAVGLVDAFCKIRLRDKSQISLCKTMFWGVWTLNDPLAFSEWGGHW